MKDEDVFITYINDNYTILKNKYRRFCKEKDYSWDEDIFSDTIVKCYDAIAKKGKLDDPSNQGIENYFFRSFKQNIQREKQYCRNAKRDLNVKSDAITDLYEEWYNGNNSDARAKIASDLYKDFATLYILWKVEENFDTNDFYLFRVKYLNNLTYKQLAEKTKQKRCRQRIVNIKNWLQKNVQREDVKKAFYLMYGNLL